MQSTDEEHVAREVEGAQVWIPSPSDEVVPEVTPTGWGTGSRL